MDWWMYLYRSRMDVALRGAECEADKQTDGRAGRGGGGLRGSPFIHGCSICEWVRGF
jgi:hypothetical protein